MKQRSTGIAILTQLAKVIVAPFIALLIALWAVAGGLSFVYGWMTGTISDRERLGYDSPL